MLRTQLYDLHLAAGGKMGPFAGYDMPLYYADGVLAEHEWTRTQAGLFDVSHMGQIMISGPGAAEFLEYVTPSSFATLVVGAARYTVLTNPQGGIVDDLIVTRFPDGKFFAVINAGCKDKDVAWLQSQLPAGIALERLAGRALIALQGPAAETVLRECGIFDGRDLGYMALAETALPSGAPIFVSRLGYTGEDGFELSVPGANAPALWEKLAAHPAVKPVGLAARDSLRLEMGYCLYGHDIDAATTPVEAGLRWVIGRGNENFIGHETVLAQKVDGAKRRRVGLLLLDKGIAREGAAILDLEGRAIGKITSGGFSPTLKQAIAQGYIDSGYMADGLQVELRGRLIPARLAKMPFVPAQTKRSASDQA